MGTAADLSAPPTELQDAQSFGLTVADVVAIRRLIEREQQPVRKRAFSAKFGRLYADAAADDVDDDDNNVDVEVNRNRITESGYDADADATGADAVAYGPSNNRVHNARRFDELRPAMRRLVLGRSN